MFTIGIDIIPSSVSGLTALDRRRALRLPDESQIDYADKTHLRLEVSEAFAREHFDPTSREIVRKVAGEALTAEDVAVGVYSSQVVVRKGLAPDRIIALWLAAK